MSGHNKFSQIKRKKGLTDAKKSKSFSMFARLITIASKQTNGDPNSPVLRTIIEKARKASMPKDNIDRAIKKGTDTSTSAYGEVTFETYGPGGVGVIITGISDNKNRTSQEIKHLLSKSGYELANPGSVVWAFSQGRDEEDGAISFSPTTHIPLSEIDKEKLEALIETLEEHEDIKAIFTNEE